MSKYVDMIGWEDCPHLKEPFTSKEELDALEAEMAPHLREARRKGIPSLGAGAIYPVPESQFWIEPFKIPDYYERGWAIDVGWNKTAALFGARDPDTDITYLTHEYYEGELEPIKHAYAILQMLPWTELAGAMDPAAKGRSQKDGVKLKDEYEKFGLELAKADNAVSAGIHRVLTLLQGGQLKVFNTLLYWRKEFRLYRRNEKGKIVKENDHLMDCTRYLLKTDNIFTTEPLSQHINNIRGEW